MKHQNYWILIVLLAVANLTYGQSTIPFRQRVGITLPRYHALPAKYSESLKPQNAEDMRNQNVLILGDQSVHCEQVSGQGGAIGLLALDKEMGVIGGSNNSEPCSNTRWPHYKVDFTDSKQIDKFFDWVQKINWKLYKRTTFDKVFITIGKMLFAYEEDDSWETEEWLIKNNFGGVYHPFDVMRSRGMLHNSSKVGITISDGTDIPTGNSDAYEVSKTALEKKVIKLIFRIVLENSQLYIYGLSPDAVYNTSITCNTRAPIVKQEQCIALINRNSNLSCPLFVYFPSLTTAMDIAHMHLDVIMADPRPVGQKPGLFVMNAPDTVDDVGGQVIDWMQASHESDPYQWSKAFQQHFGNPNVLRTLSPRCNVPPPGNEPIPVGSRPVYDLDSCKKQGHPHKPFSAKV